MGKSDERVAMCPFCVGSGEVYVTAPVPSPTRHRCPNCNGTGTTNAKVNA